MTIGGLPISEIGSPLGRMAGSDSAEIAPAIGGPPLGSGARRATF
jgi:hypothetical protein